MRFTTIQKQLNTPLTYFKNYFNEIISENSYLTEIFLHSEDIRACLKDLKNN